MLLDNATVNIGNNFAMKLTKMKKSNVFFKKIKRYSYLLIININIINIKKKNKF